VRVDAIRLLNEEWLSVGRSAGARDAVALVAARDASVAALAPRCPDGLALLAYMHPGAGWHASRNESAALVAVLLREADAHPLVPRFIVQALVPGLLGVGARLRWGQNGPWQDSGEFLAETLSVAWEVIVEWSGEDRAYAALDLLSAIRGRLRRMLYKYRDHGSVQLELFPDRVAVAAFSVESDLELLARTLAAADYLAPAEADVLYATAVLGFPMTELSRESGVPVGTLRRRRRAAQAAMVNAQ
jgi:hypothetical protein